MFCPLLLDTVEGQISFPPTFKYDVGSNRLDSSKKARCPAWTDRILFYSAEEKNRRQQRLKKKVGRKGGLDNSKGDADERIAGVRSNSSKMKGLHLRLKKYYSVEARSSDHRPVCAEFLLSLSE